MMIGCGLVAAAIACFGRLADGQIQVQRLGRWPPGEQDAGAGVYLPNDRAISRAIDRVRERLDAGEYHEALNYLHGLLGREEDWFLEREDRTQRQAGVKATARRLIGELPAEGHAAYELLQGAAARRQLEAALDAGSRDAVAAVVRQFFHTAAGYEAALVLAQMEADQGHHLAAAQLYQELLDSPRAAQQFEPQLSLLAALNHLAAGEREAAANTLRSLIERQPAAQFRLSGNDITAPSADANLAEWLTRVAGTPTQSGRSERDWLMSGGSASRNVDVPGGRPHLRARWRARVINDPGIESYLAARNNDFTQRGVVVLPGARPLAIGDVVVMRTPKNIVAVDWNTGKRIWETREDGELDEKDGLSQFAGEMDREQWATQNNPVEERVWDDALATSLSSDGERVYLLRDRALPESQQAMAWQLGGAFGAMGGEMRPVTNQLAAYDLATEGKLVWELDGSRAAPPLDGVYFLGAPLAIDNTLYVMAEIRSAIYLLALNPTSGAIQWQQQLAGLEQSIGLDPMRRRAGATPSYAAGIMVCPTAAGAVIGVDIVKREFAWVYRYPREAKSVTEIRNMLQNTTPTPSVRVNDDWLDRTAIISDGHVFLTPPESGELHCVDLHSGRLAWKHRQGDALFIGCVDSGNVLLVGAEGVQALKIADGMDAWPQEFVSLPSGAIPAGRGYLSEGRFYLPLTSGEIAEIETKSGALSTFSGAAPEMKLGNLICHRGSVMSQSALVLDKFEQLDVLRERTESTLKDNSDDPTALRELAELKRTEGQQTEAVKLLKRASQLAPEDALTQEMLVESLLEALANDYDVYRNDIPLLARLVRDRQQQVELLRIEACGLDEAGQRLAAFDAYLRLADFTAEDPTQLRIDAEHTVRSDRWVCGQLGELWSAASKEERNALREKLAARRPAPENQRTAAELRHYLAHTGALPGASDVRLALAKYLVDRDRTQEAEIQLLQLAASSEDEHRTAASELLEKLDSQARPSKSAGNSEPWPAGKVKAEFFPTSTRDAKRRRARLQTERQAGYRQLRIEQDSSSDDPSAIQWFVAMDCSELVGRNALGDDVVHLAVDQSSWARPHRDSSLVHAARLGRMLYVVIGGQVLAVHSPSDGLGGSGDVLWRTDSLTRYSTNSQQARRSTGDTPARANRRPVYHTWSGRKRMIGAVGAGVYTLGPATPRGVVFQEHDVLKCVDPLTGEVLWTRGDLPIGCELFGDMEYVFAADASGRVAYVIRMMDGWLLGEREMPKHEWLLTVGRNVVEGGYEGRENRVLVRVSDMYSQKVLYENKFPQTSRVAVMEPETIAVYEPGGRFRIINGHTGTVKIDQQLKAVPDVQNIHVTPAGDMLLLFVSKTPNQQYKPLVQQSEYPLVNGLTYAFDRESGEPLWPQPAKLDNRGVLLSQPPAVPLLVCAERKLVRDPTTGGGSQLRLMCLDQRTGERVYSNEALPDTSITRFRIRGERDGEATVAVEMSAGKIVLTMTDEPRRADSSAGEEAPTETEDVGSGGINRRIVEALQGALEKSAQRDEKADEAAPDDD